MARHSPTGFAFSMLFEIAAVVVIVSLLPRFDLQPRTTSAAHPVEPPTFTPSLVSIRRPALPAALPPVDPEPPVTRYVEERLDRASQKLVNSLGSAVAQTAGDFLAATPPPAPLPPPPNAFTQQPQTPLERRLTLLPPPVDSRQPRPAGSFSTQPRPWIRY